MDREAVRKLLADLVAGRIDVDSALRRLRTLPYEDLGFARVDHHRAVRSAAAEAVFCPGKTPEQVVAVLARLAQHHSNVVATRAGAEVAAAVSVAGLPHAYHADARLVIVRPERAEGVGLIVVATAGTADLPVAEEAALVAEALGNRVERVYDCAVAGMEGALPSVIGGLVDRPVIAVPTSVGYGASFGGIAALLAMLNSCAPGVSVVNIDNGFGAAHQASQINHLVAKIR